MRESGGWGDAASDEEIVDAIKLLARTEGIFAEPAGGTTLAVTLKLIAQGRIRADETVVVIDHRQWLQNPGSGGQAIEQPVRDRSAAQGLRRAVRAAAGRETRAGRAPPNLVA